MLVRFQRSAVCAVTATVSTSAAGDGVSMASPPGSARCSANSTASGVAAVASGSK